MKAIKWLAIAVVGVCAALVVAFVCYDALAFQPQRARIAALISSSHPLDQRPPRALVGLLAVDFHGDFSIAASRQILFSLYEAPRGGVAWHAKSTLWWLLVRLHVSRDDQIAIIAAHSYLGIPIPGYQACARATFGRDIDSLTEPELATLVAYSRFPHRFRNPEHSADLRRAVSRLIARAKATGK